MPTQAPLTASKIVFLDMDGPVCSRRSHVMLAKPTIGGLWRECDPIAIQFLNRLYMTDPEHTRLVLCSQWRVNHPKPDMERFLGRDGLIMPFHDDWMTPIRRETPEDRGHGHDVKAWLDNHQDITTWVAIDDEGTYTPEQKPHLVKATLDDGISFDNMADAFEILHGLHLVDASKAWRANYARLNLG